MRYPGYALLLAFAFTSQAHPLQRVGFAPPTPDPLAEARQRLQRGNYAEARAAFEAQAKDAKLAVRAAVGIAAAWRAEGEYSRALTALEDALKANAGHPDLLAARADLFYALGKWDDALKDADAAIAKQEKHFLAKWVRVQIIRDKGDLPTADKDVRWFVREYTEASNADRPITDPDTLLVIGQAGTENARWHNLANQFRFILTDIYGDALKADPDCWQAESLAGRMLLEKHNRPEALDAFDKAIKINPKAVEALVGKGIAALQTFDLKEAERLAEQALKVNPKHPAALRLKADVLRIGGDFASAERLLTAAKLINPRDEATLARLAACHFTMQKPDAFAAVVKEVEAFDTKPATFYADLAECLEERKQYAKAEEFYRKATELRPMVPAPRAGFGMLLLRQGKEAEAQPILDAAFKADPFNIRVSNSLKVLKHLDGYQTVETAHYVLKFDPKTDKVLAAFLADYLEQTHADLKRQFNYEPPGKVLVEVFATREMFSGRTIALPSLPDMAAGACSGRLITLPSPRAQGGRPYNWARVIRHELTHAFNLIQTDFQVPHWLTEGLAVRNEGGDRPPAWMAVLRDKYAAGQLLDLDNITLAFVRPRTEEDWALAYCQALLYVEYLTKTHGEAAVGKLLEAYRSGNATATILKQSLGVEQAAFEAGYRQYVEDVVKGGGPRRRAEKPLTFPELEAANKKDPDDPDIAARLAGEYLRRNKPADALKLADAALAKEKGHALASVVKARLLSKEKKDAAARAVLEEAEKENPDDPRVLLALGRVYIEAKQLDDAAKLYERGRKSTPLDGDWLTELARIYNTLGKNPELIAVLTEMAARDPDDVPVRLKLAKIAAEAGKHAEAERFAREVLFIDVLNPDARGLLIDALKAQNKTADAEVIAKRFE